MAIALLTGSALAFASLLVSLYLGYAAGSGSEVLQHTTWSVFATLIVLLSHSFSMFYLIGKGRAIRDAATEGHLSGSHAAEVAVLRRPVFTIGTLAITLTMATAILGGGVDTGVLPTAIHSFLALASIAANAAALRVEAIALMGSVRIATEVDRLLGADPGASVATPGARPRG
jgi:hypothetical protein